MERETGHVTVLLACALAAAWMSWVMLHARLRGARRVPLRVDERPRRHRSARHVHRLLALLAVPASLLTFGTSASAAQAVRYGVMMDLPRSQLGTLWSDDAEQVERAYCVMNYSAAASHSASAPSAETDTIFRVWSIREAETNGAGPNSVDFECPKGIPELHTHTPSTCAGDDVRTCVAGGLNAYSCQPSRQDLEKLARRGDPFAVIQCDRRAFRFYYPSEYAPVTVQVAAGGGASKPDAGVPLPMRKEKPRTP